MNHLRRSLACLVVLVIAAGARAESIIDEHIKQMGGTDPLAAVKTIKRSGTVSMQSGAGRLDGRFEEIFDLMSRSGYTSMDLGLYFQQTGWIGDAGWRKDPNQGLRDLPRPELGIARLNASVSLIADIRRQFGLAAFTDPADEAFNDTPCIRVGIVNNPVVLYLNKQTKLLEGVAITGLFEITYGDYRPIDGIPVFYKSTATLPTAGLKIAYSAAKVELNTPVAPDKFEKPKR